MQPGASGHDQQGEAISSCGAPPWWARWTLSSALPIMGGAETDLEAEPSAEAAGLGEVEADTTVIEGGGTDLSTETEIETDDSVSQTVIVEAPTAPVEHSHDELAHCEHCEAHEARIAALESQLAAAAAVVEEEIEEAAEEPEPVQDEAPAELPGEDEDEDVAPKRVWWGHRKLWGN